MEKGSCGLNPKQVLLLLSFLLLLLLLPLSANSAFHQPSYFVLWHNCGQNVTARYIFNSSFISQRRSSCGERSYSGAIWEEARQPYSGCGNVGLLFCCVHRTMHMFKSMFITKENVTLFTVSKIVAASAQVRSVVLAT